MSKFITKRQKALVKLTEKGKSYPLKEAIAVLKTAPTTKFDPSVELQFKLGVDLAASDQGVRGTAMLPHGRGKKLRVIVFSKDESAKAAREAGADFVGGDDLIEKVLGGWMDFDVAIATPSLMKDIAKLGKLLGPRGLMPSPKAGTVTDNPARAIQEINSGRIEFKMDKFGNVNLSVGKLSFPDEKLCENGTALIESLVAAKPKSLKGVFVRSSHLSSTMGPGVRLDITKFLKEKEEAE
ncbi:MAG: 50S ribosomal protein L1 [Omnitrophica bacterium RIFCSPHIGHO2_02_FULL_51_18]|nr:MAG: 50S ribosomal protein L1 [Omnitrophica bacterium RIFCSPHIGHO2_02_FULL_51_18]